MSIIDNVKVVVKTVQQIDNIELYRQILNLQSEVNDLVAENNRLKSDLQSLTEELKIKRSLKFLSNAYFCEQEDGKREGPFCSNCWDTKQKLVHMLIESGDDYARCPSCTLILDKTTLLIIKQQISPTDK